MRRSFMLNAIEQIPGNSTLWVVGDYLNSSSAQLTLTERYS
jgi:hypothetical protein